jgi:hypothetical protein
MGERRGHPADDDLFAWAAGDRAGREAVGAHVATCAACEQTAAAWTLAAVTVRADDAPPIPAALRARAVALFADAPFLAPTPMLAPTADPLAAVRDAVAAAANEAAAGLRRLVAVVTFDSWGALAPGFAGVRSGGPGRERQLSWMAGALEVDLQASRVAEGAWMLLGQVAAPAGTAVRAVELAPAGEARAVATAEPDEFGAFDLAATAGAWDIRVRLDDALVVLPGLDVR